MITIELKTILTNMAILLGSFEVPGTMTVNQMKELQKKLAETAQLIDQLPVESVLDAQIYPSTPTHPLNGEVIKADESDQEVS